MPNGSRFAKQNKRAERERHGVHRLSGDLYEAKQRIADLEASNNKLRDALSIALQYVPLGHEDATEIHTLVKEATK